VRHLLTNALTTAAFTIINTAWSATHEYHLRFADDLKRVDVTARLHSKGLRLRARGGDVRSLDHLSDCSGGALAATRGRTVELPAGTDCVTYGTSIEQPRRGRRFNVDQPGVTVSSPSRWLWAPSLGQADRVLVTAEVPVGAKASFPWRGLGENRFEFTDSPRSGYGLAVIGDFVELDLSAAGITKRAAYVGPIEGKDKIHSWLTASGAMLRDVAGNVPNDQVQVVVFPVSRTSDGSPVPFGRVIRDQGEAIQFFVDLRQPLSRYLDDWTAPHEFAHTLVPYVDAQWVSEGFAGYFQNVMLARSGVYTEERAWQRLVGSFAKAAATKNPPSPNGTSDRPFWEVRMLLYWSAAAIALIGDAELRSATNNQASLDTALGNLARCCLPSPQTWRPRDLFAALDAHGGGEVFTRVYDQYANERGMPDTTAVLADLGVRLDGNRVTLDDGAPLAHVRRAIMGSGER
jgi:hypothetical protein